MSEAEQQATDILLPGAKVAIFSTDEQTLASAQATKDDWRFARVDITAVQGDVETAIEAFKSNASYTLLILQTDQIDEAFTARLGELSSYCEEGTAAIVVGPVNDVYLYRQLIGMGVSDYLVRPILPDVMSEVIAKTLIQRLGVSGSRLIAFTGTKGGVGTSTFAQIAAMLSAGHFDNATTLLDAAGGYSSLSVGLGFDSSATLPEVYRAIEAKKEDALKRTFFNMSDKLTILATGADAMLDPLIPAAQFEVILNTLMAKSPVVLVDLSGAEASVRKAVIARAHKTIIMATPTITSLRFCRSLLKEIAQIKGGDSDDVALIINQHGCVKGHEVPKADIKEALEFEPDAYIPYLPNLFMKYESDIKDLISDKDASAVVTTFLGVLKKCIPSSKREDEQENVKNSGFLGDFLSKLTTK